MADFAANNPMGQGSQSGAAPQGSEGAQQAGGSTAGTNEQFLAFTGTIRHVIFTNAENGYSILVVSPDKEWIGKNGVPATSVKCVGTIFNPAEDMNLRFQGGWVQNPRYGRQFAFVFVSENIPTKLSDLIGFLSNSTIKGIGHDIAKRIVKKFGQDTIRIMDDEPERLLEVKGIGKSSLQKIKESWTLNRKLNELLILLQPYGISASCGKRIFDQYGYRALDIIRSNPYRLAVDINGIGFKTADNIAMKVGVALDSPLRMQAGLLYCLQLSTEQGNVYVPEEELLDMASKQLGATEEQLIPAIDALSAEERILREDMLEGKPDAEGRYPRAIYLNALYVCETKTAYYLSRILHTPGNVYVNDAESVKKAIAQQKYTLVPEQADAVRLAARSKVMVLTGGPGTGKTTIINTIIDLFAQKTAGILLAAPTGRAAKRMKEATGRDACTLHRLLEYRPKDDDSMEFGRNEDTPLQCDLLIVDEASMMDIRLFYYLLKAVPAGAVVIFVGDIHQLPSVGPGSVLSDIIASNVVPVAELREIHRQAGGSDIIVKAHEINEGTIPGLRPPKGRESDFYFMHVDDYDEISKVIVDLVSRRLPNHYGFNPLQDIQVLTPMHKGALGATNMNHLLQERLNPNGLSIKRGDHEFRVGDKVMQIRNDYKKAVFNGDIGQIIDINLEKKIMKIHYDEDVTYEFTDLEDIVLAYAISIHKSQGSEYPAVVIPLHMQHYIMLQRNLIYTAITRGAKLVVIVGNERAFAMAVRNNAIVQRYTRLALRLSS